MELFEKMAQSNPDEWEKMAKEASCADRQNGAENANYLSVKYAEVGAFLGHREYISRIPEKRASYVQKIRKRVRKALGYTKP